MNKAEQAAMDRKLAYWEATKVQHDEQLALRARVAELEAALGKLIGAVDRMKANAADGIADEARAALAKS